MKTRYVAYTGILAGVFTACISNSLAITLAGLALTLVSAFAVLYFGLYEDLQ